MLHYCRMKQAKKTGRAIENTPKKEQNKSSQNADNQHIFIRFIAEIIVEIIIKETVHGNNSAHQKDN